MASVETALFVREQIIMTFSFFCFTLFCRVQMFFFKCFLRRWTGKTEKAQYIINPWTRGAMYARRCVLLRSPAIVGAIAGPFCVMVKVLA